MRAILRVGFGDGNRACSLPGGGGEGSGLFGLTGERGDSGETGESGVDRTDVSKGWVVYHELVSQEHSLLPSMVMKKDKCIVRRSLETIQRSLLRWLRLSGVPQGPQSALVRLAQEPVSGRRRGHAVSLRGDDTSSCSLLAILGAPLRRWLGFPDSPSCRKEAIRVVTSSEQPGTKCLHWTLDGQLIDID